MKAHHGFSSRLPGFYRKPIAQRRDVVFATSTLSSGARYQLAQGGLELDVADRMSENVISTLGLPLAVALNFRMNGRDHLVPMAIEEPSVVAAASNAARLVRLGGGFEADADESVMTAQVHLSDVTEMESLPLRLRNHAQELLALGDGAIASMVLRGGGCRDITVRELSREEGIAVVEIFVDVRDAMGANVVDAVAEALAPEIAQRLGGSVGLRILSNLPLRRTARASCWLSDETLGGVEVAQGIINAARFAELDPLRAVTHNKGIMNGVVALGIATGQDTRALEAGAHAFAALSGRYRPLSVWRRDRFGVRGRVELPLAVGTVGGTLRAHAGARAALELTGVSGARELASLAACVGLASNLAALRALSGEGIQRGHMKLHNRRNEEETWREQMEEPRRNGTDDRR